MSGERDLTDAQWALIEPLLPSTKPEAPSKAATCAERRMRWSPVSRFANPGSRATLAISAKSSLKCPTHREQMFASGGHDELRDGDVRSGAE